MEAARAAEKAKKARTLGEVVSVKKLKSPVDIGLFKRYIRSIEESTGRKLNGKQIEELKKALRNNKYEKLTPEENLIKRREFNNKKDGLIKEWEKQTGQEWPKYDEVILDKNGKPYRNIGDKYDAHHVIENNYGRNDEWWNSHPAKSPSEHQGGIHGSGAPSREIFKYIYIL